jgi:hypothetical protein
VTLVVPTDAMVGKTLAPVAPPTTEGPLPKQTKHGKSTNVTGATPGAPPNLEPMSKMDNDDKADKKSEAYDVTGTPPMATPILEPGRGTSEDASGPNFPKQVDGPKSPKAPKKGANGDQNGGGDRRRKLRALFL